MPSARKEEEPNFKPFPLSVDVQRLLARQAEQFRAHICRMEEVIPLFGCYGSEYQSLTFRPSTFKKDPILQFVPINLHFHSTQMWTSGLESLGDAGASRRVHDQISFGAPAAHLLGFKGGVGLRQMLQGLSQCKLEAEKELAVLAIEERLDVVLPQALAALVTSFALKLRTCWADPLFLPQLAHLGFLVHFESLLSTYKAEMGMLADADAAISLLSNFSFKLLPASAKYPLARNGMAGLAYIRAQKVSLVSCEMPSFITSPSASSISSFISSSSSSSSSSTSTSSSSSSTSTSSSSTSTSSSSTSSSSSAETSFIHSPIRTPSSWPGTFSPTGRWRGKFVIGMALPQEIYEALPESLKRGGMVSVFPLLFTQGINEQQTLAIVSNDTKLQEEINLENACKLIDFFELYKKHRAKLQPDVDPLSLLDDNVSSAPDLPIRPDCQLSVLQKDLDTLVQLIRTSHREKNTQILPLAADWTRRVLAGRSTSCKSAKDRTSMSITWEQARILSRYHEMPESEIASVRNQLRSQGVRLENAFKNIGKKKYAFSNLQLRAIPEEYRAPSSVAANATT